MKRSDPVSRWRAAEASSDERAVERALSDLFAMLAEPAPACGFAAAVLRRIETLPAPAVVPAAMRWLVAAAMIGVASSLVVLPVTLRSLGGLFQVGATVELLSSALVLASGALASWLELWQSLVALDRVLLNIVSKPHVALPLVAALGLSLAALALVSRLTASHRSRRYA